MTLPNFLYIGPDKAGSSWLHEALIVHPDVYLSSAKDLYFFDRYYDRGIDWYESQFEAATGRHLVVGEVCQDYLSNPLCPTRIAADLPDARLMMTVRDPVARAFSSYLYMRKHGLGPATFGEALRSEPELIEHGRYGAQLRRYREHFDPDRIHVAVFDDLGADPQQFLDDVTRFLGLSRLELTPELAGVRLAAGRARIVPLARAVRMGADVVRKLDGANLVAKVKRSELVQRMLYQPLGDDKPTVSPADEAYVREALGEDLAMLEVDLGLNLREKWGWADVTAG